jgi:hypothetical protein
VDDIDCDGEKELLYQAADMNCYVHGKGASVFELDSFKSKQNYCCVYGADPAKPANSFVDKIFGFGSFEEELLDLGAQPYSMVDHEKSPHKIAFGRDFGLKTGTALHPFAIRKSFLFQKYCLSVDIELANRSQHQVSLRYAAEINLQPSAGWDESEFLFSNGRDKEKLPWTTELPPFSSEALFIQSAQGKEVMEIRSDKPFQIKMYHRMDRLAAPELLRLHDGRPEEDDAGTAKGELCYQGTRMLFGWDATMPADSSATFSLSLHF